MDKQMIVRIRQIEKKKEEIAKLRMELFELHGELEDTVEALAIVDDLIREGLDKVKWGLEVMEAQVTH